MCTDLFVTFPAVTKFLLFFSLRTGCIVNLLYTSARTSLFILFTVIAMLETLVSPSSAMGRIVANSTTSLDPATVYCLFFSYQVLIIAESFLLIFCMHLTLAILYNKLYHYEYFITCRTSTWLVETSCLIILCVQHRPLLGWYLLMLLSVIIELYFCMVVLSQYKIKLLEEHLRKKPIDRKAITEKFLSLVY
ncbi:uncharacterized protein LOC113239698 [Hyposmocoma kahamanoa]|uniref:uncharacterized protein LOC113239698 n=1 Tax=Hyposmocoma kahamanoa TaxID=1477025 RepID=UPI000E6D7291|nr:uncharacterized protein LOC113239698 [Hyposmocoma kahamanoa]